MDILIIIALAICIGCLVATFLSFVWSCVAFMEGGQFISYPDTIKEAVGFVRKYSKHPK